MRRIRPITINLDGETSGHILGVSGGGMVIRRASSATAIIAVILAGTGASLTMQKNDGFIGNVEGAALSWTAQPGQWVELLIFGDAAPVAQPRPFRLPPDAADIAAGSEDLIAAIEAAADEISTAVSASGSAVTAAVNTQGDNITEAVNEQGTATTAAVNTQGVAVVNAIADCCEAQLENNDDNAAAIVTAVNNNAATVGGEVNTQGGAIVSAVNTKGTATVNQISALNTSLLTQLQFIRDRIDAGFFALHRRINKNIKGKFHENTPFLYVLSGVVATPATPTIIVPTIGFTQHVRSIDIVASQDLVWARLRLKQNPGALTILDLPIIQAGRTDMARVLEGYDLTPTQWLELEVTVGTCKYCVVVAEQEFPLDSL